MKKSLYILFALFILIPFLVSAQNETLNNSLEKVEKTTTKTLGSIENIAKKLKVIVDIQKENKKIELEKLNSDENSNEGEESENSSKNTNKIVTQTTLFMLSITSFIIGNKILLCALLLTILFLLIRLFWKTVRN